MSRILNQPLMMEPGYAKTFISGLANRFNISNLYDMNGEVLGREKLRVRAGSYSPGRDRDRPYRVEDGIAVLPIDGTLVNKFGYMQPSSGMTGYDGILARASDAFNDPEIRGVLMDMDTPGGDVAGCFDCVASLRKMAAESEKPFWSLGYDMYASAGMALASATDRRLITSTAVAGSIGVIMAHASMEKQLAEKGIEVTLIYAGAHKADGNPYQKLSEDVYKRFLAKTESLRGDFAQIVATNTGISLEQVLATEAQSYRGSDAVQVGLADEVVNGNEAIQIFSDYLSTQGKTISLGVNMSDTENKVIAEAKGKGAALESQKNKPLAVEESREKTNAQAVSDDRQRMNSIMSAEEAKGRETLANHLAFKTSLNVEDAIATLKASDQKQEASTSHKTALDMVMKEEKTPVIGADLVDASAEVSGMDKAVEMFNQQHGISA